MPKKKRKAEEKAFYVFWVDYFLCALYFDGIPLYPAYQHGELYAPDTSEGQIGQLISYVDEDFLGYDSNIKMAYRDTDAIEHRWFKQFTKRKLWNSLS